MLLYKYRDINLYTLDIILNKIFKYKKRMTLKSKYKGHFLQEDINLTKSIYICLNIRTNVKRSYWNEKINVIYFSGYIN